MPSAALAISSVASRAAARKCSLSSRSSGGYPVTASSGNSTSSAPRSRARAIHSRILRAMPSMSPTRELTWASATRSGVSGPAMAPTLPRRRAVLPARLGVALAEPEIGELAQARIAGRRGAQAMAPGQPGHLLDRGVAAEDHGLPGGGEVAVERAGELVLEAAQRGRRCALRVDDHDVAELERVQELVVAGELLARGHTREMRPVRRRVGLVGRRIGALVRRALVAERLARAGDRLDRRLVARGEHEHDR